MAGNPEITADHIWSAIRGLGLMQKSYAELDTIEQRHAVLDAFTSRVVVVAVKQVRAVRFAVAQGVAA